MTALSKSNTPIAAARVSQRKTASPNSQSAKRRGARFRLDRSDRSTLQSNVNHGTPPRGLHEAPLRMTAGALSHTRNRSARKSTRAAFGRSTLATEESVCVASRDRKNELCLSADAPTLCGRETAFGGSSALCFQSAHLFLRVRHDS